MRVLVALVLLLALLPVPPASAASWSLDARITVTSTTSADYTWTITGLPNTNLTLPLPDSATFVEARDVDGKALSSGVVGENVYVVSKDKPYVVRFFLQGEVDGPFTIFPAQVASDVSSPVSVAIAMPAGWALAGYRDNEGGLPDASGVFRKTGPAYVQFLALPPGTTDPGPDLTVAGNVVKRVAHATISTYAVAWSLTTTYDTDVFRREWDVHIPAGATLTGASTPFGPLATQVEGDSVRLRTPYPVGYGLGARSFTLDMTLPAPEAHGGAFRQANLSVRAAEGDIIRVSAELGEGARYAGARVAGGREIAPLAFEAAGPLSIGIAFLPPPAPGNVQFDEGMFVVDAPASFEAAARASARNATAQLPRVADFAFSPADERPFFIAYTEAPIFGWEKGFYSNGLNTISIRASTLEEAPTDGSAGLTAVGVLVHEATHGLVDRMLPEAPHNVSLLHEGLSRLAETRLEAHFADQVMECKTVGLDQQCTPHSARPILAEVREFHQALRTLDTAWSASSVPEAERGFLYDYSGLVMNAFDKRAPPGALANALAHVGAATFSGDAGAEVRLVVDILLANAPGTTEQALLYPGRELNGRTEEAFRYCMGALLAPRYPWESAGSAPPGGCPATGYGGAQVELPPAPEPEEEPVTTQPSPVVSPRPTFEVPTSFPTQQAPGTGSGEIPAGVVDADDPPRPGSTVVPGAGVFALLALAALGALVTRRR